MKERTKPATIYDVAEVAGVSHQTVARIVRGDRGYRQQTRDRVTAAIVELRYVPNESARSLATKRPRRIAVLTYEMDQVGPSEAIRGASQAAQEAGYLLDIVTLNLESDLSIAEAVELIHQQDLAGVIALVPTERIGAALETTRFRVPMQMYRSDSIQNHERGLDLGADGLYSTTEHLLDRGHERLFHIGGPAEWLASQSRRRAFEVLVRQRGFEPVGVRFAGWSARAGYEIAHGLDLDTLTGIVAANDQLALGIIHALHTRGVRVPEDISVTGVDDIPEASFFWPPLTTVSIDLGSVGRRAVHELLARIGSGDISVKAEHARAQLRVRESTGIPRTRTSL